MRKQKCNSKACKEAQARIDLAKAEAAVKLLEEKENQQK